MGEIHDQLATFGWARFESDADEPTIAVARRVGKIANIPSIDAVQELRPKEGLGSSSYSDLYGMDEFPLHTDMAHWHSPPRYIFLRCIVPAIYVGTNVARSFDIFAKFPPTLLRRALFKSRRTLDGGVSILRLVDGGIARWDQVFIEPLSEASYEVAHRVSEEMAAVPIQTVFLDRGECLLIDNWKALHGRSRVSDRETSRVLHRCYLDKLGEV